MEMGKNACRCLMCRIRLARCAKGQKRPGGEWLEKALGVASGKGTDVEMVSIFLGWKLSTFFDHTVPAIFSAVFMYFGAGHHAL